MSLNYKFVLDKLVRKIGFFFFILHDVFIFIVLSVADILADGKWPWRSVQTEEWPSELLFSFIYIYMFPFITDSLYVWYIIYTIVMLSNTLVM